MSRSPQHSKRPEYPAIDVIKIICAALVVAIHIAPLSSYSNIELMGYMNYGIRHYLARVAVPFFFSTAGFLLFQKMDKSFDLTVVRQYVFKLLRLFGTWTILLFVGSKLQLWYMGGLVVAVLFLTLLTINKVSAGQMVGIALVFCAIGLLGDSYYGLMNAVRGGTLIDSGMKAYEALFHTTRNGLFMGFPYVLMGGLIQRNHVKMKPVTAITGFVVSMAALFGEVVFLKMHNLPKDYNMYLFLLPAVFFLLVFATNLDLPGKAAYKSIRVVSMIVFYSHMFVYQWIAWGLAALGSLTGVSYSNSLLNYCLTVVLSAILGFAVHKASQKKSLSFLKYLYS